MFIWIFFSLMSVLAFLNISANLKAETVVENYSSEIVKIVRREKLELEILEQMPLSETQKEALISFSRRSSFHTEYEGLKEFECNLKRYERRSLATGAALTGLVIIPLFWAWFW